MSQEETTQILSELLKSIKTRGFRKTLNLLKTNRKVRPEITDKFDLFLIKSVASAFDISEDELLEGKYIRGENKYAIGMCVYFMYENKSLGEIHKRIFVNKNKTLLSKYRQLIFDLRTNSKEDKRFLEIRTELENKIENYKKDNK